MKKIIIRRDLDKNWKSQNPVLMHKELIYVTDLNKYKLGDGNSTYNDLPYTDNIDLSSVKDVLFTIGDFVITIKD